MYYTFNYAKGVLLLFIYRIALRDIERKVREMAKKIASEKLDEEDGSIVIDADEEQATIDAVSYTHLTLPTIYSV